ncbi:BarA sensory histidine kinase (= VarS = GacS) [hydrothermal vent metagenome]|uniref:histidine kinase n=1 Tax=hydrothermal vent metagenome TaxID=652676 RepID=A0A3B0X8J4_9ZZZZ
MGQNNSNIVISSGFTAILLLLVVLMSISIYTIIENNKSISDILEKQKDSEDIFNMRDAANHRALYLYYMASLKDPFEQDDIFLLFNDEAVNFINSITRLRQGTKNAEVFEDVEKIGQLANIGSKVQNEAIELIRNNKIEAAQILIRNKVTLAQDKVMTGLTTLYNKQQARLNLEISKIHTKNKATFLMISVVGGFAILLGLLIALYVYRHNHKTLLNIQQQRSIAEQANKSKSHFLANMSHEIRTPLTAIIGFSESMLDANRNPIEHHKTVKTIVRNGKHLLQLINDILDVSKIEAGQLQIERIDTDPLAVLNEVESIVGAQAREKGLHFNVNVQFPIPETFKSDPVRLKQILINLCCNAIKFTETGSVTINTNYRPQENIFSFTVIDTGIGMTEKAITKIFSAFTQADASTTRKFGGSGLGLTISRQLAKKMNGKIKCISKPNQGSQFFLELHMETNISTHLIYEHNYNEKDMVQSFNPNQTPKLSCNILLAEDSPDNQKLISMYVNRTGANITIVENGKQAIEKTLIIDFDLILMDMQMPVMDGITAVTYLRETGYDKPIIMLSANTLKSDLDHAAKIGVDEYIVKPINLNYFYQVLINYAPTQKKALEYQSNLEPPEIADGMQKLIQKFILSLPEKIKLLNTAYRSLDWGNLTTISHNLKGTGGSFGFHEITNIAEKINRLSQQKIESDLKKYVNELNNEIEKILLKHAA